MKSILFILSLSFLAACNYPSKKKHSSSETYTMTSELEKDYQILFINEIGNTNGVDAFGKKLELSWYIRSLKSGAFFPLAESGNGYRSWNYSRLTKFIENKCEWNDVVPGSSAVPKVDSTLLTVNQPSGGFTIKAVMLLFGPEEIGLNENRVRRIEVAIK